MKSVFTYGISCSPSAARERALAEPGAAEAAARRSSTATSRAGSSRSPGAARARRSTGRTPCRRPRVEPDRHPLADVRDLPVGGEPARRRRGRGPRARTRGARSRCRASPGRSRSRGAPEPRSFVDDEDEHRRAPDQEQRAEVLQPALREHLALLAQVRGEEDDQRRSSRARPAGTRTGRRAPRAARRSPSSPMPGSRGRNSSTIAPMPKRYLYDSSTR